MRSIVDEVSKHICGCFGLCFFNNIKVATITKMLNVKDCLLSIFYTFFSCMAER